MSDTQPDTFRREHVDPDANQAIDIDAIKHGAAELQRRLDTAASHGREGREMALARTRLEEAVMCATKAVMS